VYQDFMDGLWAANDEASLRAVADRAITRLGFRWFAYLGLDESQAILISSYPKSWTDHYFAKHYERIDPVVTSSRREKRIFSWSNEGVALSGTQDVRRFFSEAHDFGIEAGVTVPIHGGFGKFAGLTLATSGTQAEAEKNLRAAEDVLQLLALYFHARVDAQLRDTAFKLQPCLSQREVQCLAWAARGKTMVETAEIMGLTPRTVTFHLENARAKLEASNITQAVAMALRRSLIP
jgi:LuxR family transcriptional activator of conjugal transfer of Ti plasmids